MTSDGRAFNRTHEPEQPVADFNISLPQSVDVCSLHVRISAGNSAGMSAPSEAVEVGEFYLLSLQESQNQYVLYTIVCSGSSTDTTTAISTTVNSTGSGSGGNGQQTVSTTLVGKVH